MRFLILSLCLFFNMAGYAQSVYDDINGYKEYLNNLFSLSEVNSKRIDQQQVQEDAATKQNPQRYIDFMLIRYEHTEFIIQANIYYHCLGAAEELKPYQSDPAVADVISRFNATANLSKDRADQLAESEAEHEQSFQLKYGYPELVNIINYLVEDERELSEQFGLMISFGEDEN